ncbi:hypothetical protein [Blastococcus tunisiensis]|uniref:Heavy-metal-associated domain-containing protein n=1 Tax=Blastococcus tunisiensis TaxID=1798228 RepID=A0A1I2LD76_9ACTN|nr:hypothetical protein [Blastococcus sp. DSM 46838]SFF76440.1 hypothetical protein SAMN05216574_12622 [Blastococcus sp. DSM 46838]
MNTPLKLAGFGAGLLAAFGAALGVGSLVGPVGPATEAAAEQHDMGTEAAPAHDDAAGHESAPTDLPAGLAVSASGYTLDLAERSLPAGASTPVEFRILGPDGEAVTGYDVDHDVDLHLIAVRRDLTGYQHVHPERGPDGTWRAPLDLDPGSWRLFADFTPSALGENLTLGADLAVPGDSAPAPLPAETLTAEVDGYTVVLTGSLEPGRESELTLSVSRDGRPVADLQPYLGAFGHLVVLRDGDLAYLHAHPVGEPGGAPAAPGPHIRFATTAPSAGDYRLFLDFRHEDVVRTAEFTVRADAHEEEHG